MHVTCIILYSSPMVLCVERLLSLQSLLITILLIYGMYIIIAANYYYIMYMVSLGGQYANIILGIVECLKN